MTSGYYLDESFTEAVRLACSQARIETLKAGVPVFYKDAKRNLEIMEKPNGQKFQIRYIPGAPGEGKLRSVTGARRSGSLAGAALNNFCRTERLWKEQHNFAEPVHRQI